MANLHSYYDIELAADATGNQVQFREKRAEADDTSLNYVSSRRYRIAVAGTVTVTLENITSVRCLFIFSDQPFDLAADWGGGSVTTRVRTQPGSRILKLCLEGIAVTANMTITNQGAGVATVDVGLYGTGAA